MIDVAPKLIEDIKSTYVDLISKSPRYAKLKKMVSAGKASYEEAHKLAIEVGNDLAKAYKLKLSSSVLPDGKMYYNIAERLVNETIRIPHADLSGYCESVQTMLNDAAGIGMNAVIPDINQDRIDGLIERLATDVDFDSVSWILDDPIINLLQSAVDDFVRENAAIQDEAGLDPKIVRTLAGGACKWCRNLAGTYKYAEVSNTGNDVFRRHENCRCMVTYIPEKGQRQNVWTKIKY